MHGNNNTRGGIVSVDQVRPGLFRVHCEWTKPPNSTTLPPNPSFGGTSFSGNKSALFKNPSLFGKKYGSPRKKSTSSNQALAFSDLEPKVFDDPDLSFEEARQQQLQTVSVFGAPAAVPESFDFGKPTQQTSTSPVFQFGKEWDMSQQLKTSGFGGNPQANSYVSSSGANTNQSSHVPSSIFSTPPVNSPLVTSNNTCNQTNAKKETVEYVARFKINQQPYTFKTSFNASTSNVMGSFVLKQIGTKPRLFTEVDKISDLSIGDNEMVEKDDVHLPFAIWANLGKSEKENHILRFSDSDHCWVSDHFNGSFACFTGFSAGSFIAWKPLACLVWIEFETSSVGERNTLKHLTDLYVKQTYCDVRFSFKDDQHISGHRNILAARSPVFAAMFQHNMTEAITGQVNIEDSEPEIFKQLLHYIYSGRISTPLTDAIAQSLFLVADKYNIQDLKKECATFLLTCVRMDNVVGLLVWAHLHSVDALKEVTLTFVAHNAKDICRLKDWEELTKNYPDLCVLAMRRIMGCASQ